MRAMLGGLAILAASALPSAASAQATTRECGADEEPGPACLLARQELRSLSKGNLFWHLDRFTSKNAAERAAGRTSTVVQAFGSTWLFTVAKERWRSKAGEHVANVGPLPLAPSSTYAAEYLRSIFNPGTTAPLHVHSGRKRSTRSAATPASKPRTAFRLDAAPAISWSSRQGRQCSSWRSAKFAGKASRSFSTTQVCRLPP